MIKATAGYGDKSTSLEIEGNIADIMTEATMIVNTLYSAIARANPVAGAIFQHEVRIDNAVWTLKANERCEGTILSFSKRGTQ